MSKIFTRAFRVRWGIESQQYCHLYCKRTLKVSFLSVLFG